MSKIIYRLLLMTLLLVACAPEAPRIPLELTKIPVDIGPIDMAVNSQTGYIYIINQGTQVAVLKDLEQVAVLKADTPRSVYTYALTIDEAQGWVYVVNRYSDTVTVIRETEVVAVVEAAGLFPQDVAVDSHSGWAYIVSSRRLDPSGEKHIPAGYLTILDGPERIDTIDLGDVAAHRVVADPVQGYVYVGGRRQDGEGMVIVFQGREEVARVEIGATFPKFMEVNPQTGEVFVAGAYRLHRFVQGALVQTVIPIEDQGGLKYMRVHPTTGEVYLIEWSGFGLTEAIVVRHMREVARVPISPGSSKMAIDPLSGNVYLTDHSNSLVTVMHGREVITTLETGWYPYGVGVNPTNGRVYIANTNAGTVTVLGLPQEDE